MTIEEIKHIFGYSKTNKDIVAILDDSTLGCVADILANVEAKDFVEFNQEASQEEKEKMFSFLDIPIPLEVIGKSASRQDREPFSAEVNQEMQRLLGEINKEGTNVEYPYALYGSKTQEEKYTQFHKMYEEKDIEGLGRQAVVYDSAWVNQYVSKENNSNLALMHTHPAPIGKEHNTLFNKYKEVLEQLGVKPDGLNLSVADVNTLLVVDNAVKSTGKDISMESVVLMHDGTLVSFSTEDGLKVTSQKQLEVKREEVKESKTPFNEFGEIVRAEGETEIQENLDIPTFTPPEQKVEPVSIEEVRPIQAELFPETYGDQRPEIVITNTTSHKTINNERGKEI